MNVRLVKTIVKVALPPAPTRREALLVLAIQATVVME